MKWFWLILAIMLSGTSSSFAQSFKNPVDYCKAVGTIDKPDTFARPFTFETILMRADERANQIYESACYEGNYALTSMLAGQRALGRAEEPAGEVAGPVGQDLP